MFCNGPEMDGGDTACLGPTTIIEITIPRCQSSSAMTLDDAGGLAGPITNKNQDTKVPSARKYLINKSFPWELTKADFLPSRI